jgi:hypothetical protein
VKKARISSISAEQDAWLRRAYAAGVAAAKDVVGEAGPIRSNPAIGKLGDSEWGWIASAIIWGWIATRAQQAAEEGWDLEQTVRSTGLEPCPWDTGAVFKILPQLADACPDFDWSQPAGDWSKDALAGFLLTAFSLIRRATIARDAVEAQLAGNSLMTPAELKALDDGDCPF